MDPKKLVFALLSFIILGTGLWLSWNELFIQSFPIYNSGLRGRLACGDVVLRPEDRAVRDGGFTNVYMNFTESSGGEAPISKREDLFTYNGANYDAKYCSNSLLSYSRQYYYTIPAASVKACFDTINFSLVAKLTNTNTACKSMKDAEGAKLVAVEISWPIFFLNLVAYLLVPLGLLTYVWFKYLAR